MKFSPSATTNALSWLLLVAVPIFVCGNQVYESSSSLSRDDFIQLLPPYQFAACKTVPLLCPTGYIKYASPEHGCGCQRQDHLVLPQQFKYKHSPMTLGADDQPEDCPGLYPSLKIPTCDNIPLECPPGYFKSAPTLDSAKCGAKIIGNGGSVTLSGSGCFCDAEELHNTTTATTTTTTANPLSPPPLSVTKSLKEQEEVKEQLLSGDDSQCHIEGFLPIYSPTQHELCSRTVSNILCPRNFIIFTSPDCGCGCRPLVTVSFQEEKNQERRDEFCGLDFFQVFAPHEHSVCSYTPLICPRGFVKFDSRNCGCGCRRVLSQTWPGTPRPRRTLARSAAPGMKRVKLNMCHGIRVEGFRSTNDDECRNLAIAMALTTTNNGRGRIPFFALGCGCGSMFAPTCHAEYPCPDGFYCRGTTCHKIE